MRDYLIFIDLYHYIKKPDLFLHSTPIINTRLTHKQGHMKACIAMKTKLGYNV